MATSKRQLRALKGKSLAGENLRFYVGPQYAVLQVPTKILYRMHRNM
ncbi:hypothetical protein FOQG_00044 [Fusarium oxysporum f. sp. raphani 54005]|uniref:Uncharacterized protein n=4 Tax=Fusarium oxysporum TaxID=5507 RepID=X0D8U5_FUSOX|nr:hypothetical protein FOVG_03525 [Fusarium oxysporum f. sp. pisi HDV247]EXK99574.1 hypothetical protein FOQG_00044 [Fusarium oxysporum f. sp. raphani 54005]EXL79272.1 hypothetical protein FOPG_06797 [Fusarium oxysporum f. sp. conglutinans race 2 54008]EXM17299.1 hypothetical protein FOTG_14530 [Fusarium oxysporum f. sp. vasinfectum 25433]